MRKLNVLVVDPSILYRRMIEKAILSVAPKSVVHRVSSSDEARDKLVSAYYQVVMLDMNIDGVLELVLYVQQRYPHIRLILMGTGSKADVDIASVAFEMGGHACMIKPINENYERNAEAIQRYFAELIKDIADEQDAFKQAPRSAKCARQAGPIDVKVVVIAASTGGPSALEALLSRIDAPSCPPILVVQHMPAEFTRRMAEGLARKCALTVKEGQENDALRRGHIYIAPGGQHMVVRPDGLIGLTQSALVQGVRPSADVLFRSVANAYRGEGVLAIILTGMGKDSADGVASLKAMCDCYCVVQSKESCVVYGMPYEVAERGLADREADLTQIGDMLNRVAGEGVVHHER